MPRITSLRPGALRRACGAGWGLGALLLLADVGELLVFASGAEVPWSYRPYGMVSGAGVGTSLALAGLVLWGARRSTRGRTVAAASGAAVVVVNALHLVVLSQGTVSEHVGVFTLREIAYYKHLATGANPNQLLVVTRQPFAVTVRCGADSMRLPTGVGLFQLRFVEKQRAGL
ncbi:hypothetical protein [Hymenobacter lapidarius]|uniref:hypothetical protein n=1 Tax=Hymenobacter lapidarius TaxID=1908237 RepID=UPI000F7A91CE|nr:hypothetical protein [Hymenobacter lapidarius]